MKNAPCGYECPFCRVAETLPAPAPESAIVLVEPRVFAFVPLHHYAGIRSNCLIAPRLHYENVLDIPDELGNDFFRVTRLLASAMQKVFGCEGISTRQHNGPAGTVSLRRVPRNCLTSEGKRSDIAKVRDRCDCVIAHSVRYPVATGLAVNTYVPFALRDIWERAHAVSPRPNHC